MCEARVFLEKEGKILPFMDNVVTIKPENEKLLLIDLFGNRKYIDASIKELKLLEHEVILEEKE
ncbi:MAG: CooT family nickel-binding protein [Actinobacteria bacterium]|nr:CooT family nickel-binding protein [Actinomycetota bacterium]